MVDQTESRKPKTSSYDNDARVAEIIKLVTAGEFQPGRSHNELAAKWGVTPFRVSEFVTQAMRFIRLVRGNLETEIERKLAGIEDLRRRALEAGEIHNAIAADKLYLMAIGGLITKRDVTVRSSEPAKLSEAELLEQLRSEQEERARAISELEEKVRESAH
jgi:hypothetical protein